MVAGAGLLLAQTQPSAAQPASAPGRSKLDEVRARGKVIVGVTSEAPPFGFIDDKGELVGFDIDVAKMIAKATFGDDGKIELLKQGFAARWPNTQNGTIDFGIMVTTVYADRALQVAFTRPYIDSGIVVVVKKDSPVRTIADELTDLLAAADSALYYAKDNPDVRILDEWLTDVTGNGVFLHSDDFKWWLFLDTVVAEMLGGSLWSPYKAAYKKWFGVEPRHARAAAQTSKG